MDLNQFIEKLSAETGVARIELLPDEMMDAIVEEESTVVAAGEMEVVNTGMMECLKRGVRLCVFTDVDFVLPEGPTMHMVDSNGKVIGHDLSKGMVDEYACREDVMFLSDDFIVYSDMDICDASMEMLPIRFRGEDGWVPEELDVVMWYPSPTSSDILFGDFEEDGFDLAAGVLGLNIDM